jgi:hypothetical protein
MEQLCRETCRTLYNEMSTGGNYSPGTPYGDPKLWKGYERTDGTVAPRKAPPDYVPGHARASWNAAIGELPEVGTGVELALASIKVGDTVFITCTTPYIRTLEFDGHSQQAPDGFVRPAAEAIVPIVNEIAAKIAAQ